MLVNISTPERKLFTCISCTLNVLERKDSVLN